MVANSDQIGVNGGNIMSFSQISAYDVANAFVKLSDTESGDVLTNLKLQKLVYYAQGAHLAVKGTPLFADEIVAWEHGPVVVELYHKLKDYKDKQVAIEEPLNADLKSEMDFIKEINSVFGQFSAWKLRNMTHNESPWQTTPRNEVISVNKLRDYFSTQVQ